MLSIQKSKFFSNCFFVVWYVFINLNASIHLLKMNKPHLKRKKDAQIKTARNKNSKPGKKTSRQRKLAYRKNAFVLPLPDVFSLKRNELIEFLPIASKYWLFSAIMAMYDEINPPES